MKKAHELSLGDKWIRKGLRCHILAISVADPKQRQGDIIVVYQDPYTPPEASKRDVLAWDQEVDDG